MADRRGQSQIDHDLLVTLHEQVRALREVDVPSLKDGFKSTLDDHELRIRFMEKSIWFATGAAGILGSVISVLINHFLK